MQNFTFPKVILSCGATIPAGVHLFSVKMQEILPIRLHGIEYELILQRKNHTTPWPEKMRLPK